MASPGIKLIPDACPIKLIPEDSRLTTFPIARPAIFAYYQDAYKSFWTPEEISLSKDVQDFETRLTPAEKHFVERVLAFFAASDGIVNLNLVQRFKKDIPILEVGYFYDFQITIENIHAQTYSILLDTCITDPKRRVELLNAIKTIPIITKMSEYMFECINADAPFAERLLRMACVEGIFFSGCFCAIYWLTSRGLMPGLGLSNELIARDEGLHFTFALFLFELIDPEYRPAREKIQDIVREAVNIAIEFVNDALPVDLPEMNVKLMSKYVESKADDMLTMINTPIIYGSKHEFSFMDQINLTNRTNFFERRVSEYGKVNRAEKTHFEVATDF